MRPTTTNSSVMGECTKFISHMRDRSDRRARERALATWHMRAPFAPHCILLAFRIFNRIKSCAANLYSLRNNNGNRMERISKCEMVETGRRVDSFFCSLPVPVLACLLACLRACVFVTVHSLTQHNGYVVSHIINSAYYIIYTCVYP